MKKHITLGIFIASAAMGAFAAPVTPAQALQRLNSDSGAHKIISKHHSVNKMNQIASLPELYVFAPESGDGFMILPADDVAQPLLAYADSGEFEIEGNPALQWWLSTYQQQIAAAANSPAKSSQIFRVSRPAIAPLIQTRWNQSAPFNDMTPEINGVHAVTGCVATAMAQAMKYHNYPPQGIGSHSYDWTTGNETVSFNFGSTAFDWDNMLDTYDDCATEEQRQAVATLMKACGVSVDMDYTASESGAASILIGPALIDYFGYDKGIWQPERQYYGLEEWEDMIYSNLAEGLPVLYCGQGTAGGHQFICDGYSSDGFFHFNWGWGGLSDGYFQLTALDPPSLGIGGGAGGFNSNQAVVLDMRPAREDSKAVALMYCSSNFLPVSQSVSLGSKASFDGGFYNYSCLALPVGTEFGIEVIPADGSETQYLSAGKLSEELKPMYGTSRLAATFPADMAEGTYTVKPAFKPVDGEWQTMRAPLSANGELTATVSNSTVTFAENDAPDIEITDMELTSALYWGSPFTMTFNAVNDGEAEYFGTLIPCLFTADGTNTLVAEGSSYPIDVQTGETAEQSYSGSFRAPRAVPQAGTYFLVMMNAETGRSISSPIEVTLNDAPAQTSISVSNFKIQTQTSDEVIFSLTVNCTEGYFADKLTIAVFPTSGGSSLTSASTPMAYIAAGESDSEEASVSLAQLEYGEYMAAVFNGQTQLTGPVYFTVSDSATGIDQTEADTDNSSAVYNLQGQYIKHPAKHGVYIRQGKKILL